MNSLAGGEGLGRGAPCRDPGQGRKWFVREGAGWVPPPTTGQDRAVTDGAGKLDPRRWPAIGVCISALFITLLDVSIVNVALPSISRGIGAGPSQLQWVVSGYALAFGMVPIIAGRL